jgi:hypothetical protein
MPSNLLDICTRALDEISSFNVPSYIVGNSDDTAKQLLAMAKKVGTELVRDYDWQEMIQEATFITAASVSAYDLPSDYERLVSDTSWDRTTARRSLGNSTARQWNLLKAWPTSSSISYSFRIIGGQVQLQPVPPADITFAYEYLSKNYCESSGGTSQEIWTADTDLPKLSDDLFINGIRYYMLKANNLPYGDAEGEYDAVITSRTSKNVPSGAVNMSANVRRPGRGYGYRVNIADVIPH